ncbi:RNA-directed DNA polymerase, eukaryota [Tanacetum coccineum]|uniref:RNA-directed DNA polymerase, eukaryota n=1 Tax=Tanacetum coccineum TaxID=301880 RepID=A0ABQ5I674_9ASTR
MCFLSFRIKSLKQGRDLHFVRFRNKVFNLDRLVKNLCTIWIGSYHLFANQVRYDRPQKPLNPNTNVPQKYGFKEGCKHKEWINGFLIRTREVVTSYVSVVIGVTPLVPTWNPRKSFDKIGNKWGEVLNIEDSYETSFGRKVYMVRAKELFTWTPSFESIKEHDYSSEDESVQGVGSKENKYNTYEKRCLKEACIENLEPSPSLSHPPGFSPVGSLNSSDKELNKEFSPTISAKVMNNSQVVHEDVSFNSVGGRLGSKSKKEWVKELSNNNKLNFIAIQETKMEKVSHMDVKFMWGNSNYDYVFSEAAGNSGGILCIWEESFFKKDYVTISDSFVLWEYLLILLGRWNGEAILMGDYNEVRTNVERRGGFAIVFAVGGRYSISQLWHRLSEWDEWFTLVRLPVSVKGYFEGVLPTMLGGLLGDFGIISTFDVNKAV